VTSAAATRAISAALLTLLVVGVEAASLSAQDPPSLQDRDAPVVAATGPDALVLSTGSSRGLAHAGALLGLERRGYDPDLVVGASMGAVIGALYAAGYTPEQIWDLVLLTSWGDLFMASPVVAGPERQLLFPGITLALDLGTLEVSSGFIPDWRVNRFLSQLLFDAGARAHSDFDRLPRRYRSVAADLATGREVVLAQGDLARAVRASMGTPAFFAAVRWGPQLLGDGGIANYLPVSVARELGAGRVVAVDVSRAPDEVRRTDPTSLGGRSISLLMRNALSDTVPPDFLIRPALDPDMPGAVFPDQPGFLLDLGVAAALEADVSPTQEPHAHVPGAAPVRLAALEIEGEDAALAALARRAFSSSIGAYRPEAVLRAMDRLYGTGLFQGVWPRVERRGADSAAVLVVALDPRPRLALNAAAGYDNDRGGRFWSALDWRLAALGAPLESRAGAGNDGVELWFQGSLMLHSTRVTGLGWTGGIHHRRVTARFFDGDTGNPEVHRTGGWAGLQFRRSAIIASAAGQAEWVDVENGARGRTWGGMLRLSSTIAPTLMVGVPSELMARVRVGAFDYQMVAARTSVLRGFGPLRLAAVAEGALTLGDAPPDELPSLGERRGMPGLQWGQERGRGRVLGGLDLGWPVIGNGWGRMRLRAGASPDAVEELGELDGWVSGAALEGVWSTPFGPALLGYGINTGGLHRIEVGIGGAF
jgi:predicted acylesterase/phospholipase RssA